VTRIILTYGLISGAITILGGIAAITLSGDGQHGGAGAWLGYLVMLVALSSILVGVKQYRDQDLGGGIRFWSAFGLGLGIALAASLAYVVIWEIYLAATHYSFMDKYAASVLAAKRAAGVTGPAYAKVVADMDAMRRNYANPIWRFGETFLEIFPVGLLIALLAAALLRNPRFLPARSRPINA
jgi:hypothetical protein